MKSVRFCGDSLVRIQAFPVDARQDIGFQIYKLQRGESPDSWKPLKTTGKGVKEIRIKAARSHYRVIYLASLAETVYVLHAFMKKSNQTRKSDINLARKRLKELGERHG
jgi:phage-related protein